MKLTAAFRRQSDSCAAMGSPFMGRLMDLLADRLMPDHGPIAARLFTWTGDVSSAGHSLPLRLAGGLHALRLQGHAGLEMVYPPHTTGDAALWAAISDAIKTEAAFLDAWLDSPPQTNELRRASVIRAAAQWLTARTGLPLDIMELGASAGLNLNWDRTTLTIGDAVFGPGNAIYDLTPDWSGPLPPANVPQVIARTGVDLAPLNPVRDRLRLLAYLWPDQTDRHTRMEAALTLPPQPVVAGDAAYWLETTLAPPPRDGTARLIYHTVAWQYFPQDTDARARAAIEAAGALATTRTPLAWFGMEADGNSPGAALTLRLWPGDLHLDAGRADFHARWVNWALT